MQSDGAAFIDPLWDISLFPLSLRSTVGFYFVIIMNTLKKRNRLTKNELVRVRMRLCPSSVVQILLKKVKKKKGPSGRPRLILYLPAHRLLNFRIGNRVEAFSGSMTRRRFGRWRIRKMNIVSLTEEGGGLCIINDKGVLK